MCYSALSAMRFRRGGEEDRLRQLARKLEAAAKKDDARRLEAEEIARLRARGASELHATCLKFVAAVNRVLPKPMLELSPGEYSAESFRDAGSNVFQIGFSGRLIHLEFHSTDALRSTERFRTPYILEGAIRSFNQESLELTSIPEQLLFCCLEDGQVSWVWSDPRTQRAARIDQDHLITLLERLL